MIWPILSKGVDLSSIVEHSMIPLFKIQELFQLAAEQTHR
jgi:hypothetical protein